MKRGLGRDAKPTIDHPSKRNSEEKNKKREGKALSSRSAKTQNKANNC